MQIVKIQGFLIVTALIFVPEHDFSRAAQGPTKIWALAPELFFALLRCLVAKPLRILGDATGHGLSVAMPIAPIDATLTPASLNGLRCPPSINRVVRISRDIEILA
jgi:hypothetical protein